MLECLANYGSVVETVAIVILVFVTGVYAWQTRKMVAESKKFRELTMRPNLTVTATVDEYHLNIINLRISNTGGGTARDIRLRIDKKFRNTRNVPLNDLGLFRKGLPLLGPGQKIETRLANATGRSDLFQQSFTVTAKYTNAARTRSFERRLLD